MRGRLHDSLASDVQLGVLDVGQPERAGQVDRPDLGREDRWRSSRRGNDVLHRALARRWGHPRQRIRRTGRPAFGCGVAGSPVPTHPMRPARGSTPRSIRRARRFADRSPPEPPCPSCMRLRASHLPTLVNRQGLNLRSEASTPVSAASGTDPGRLDPVLPSTGIFARLDEFVGRDFLPTVTSGRPRGDPSVPSSPTGKVDRPAMEDSYAPPPGFDAPVAGNRTARLSRIETSPDV